MQQQLKVIQQQKYFEELKQEEDTAVAWAYLEAITDSLCWSGFGNILAAGLPTPAEKVGMLLSRNATSPPPILSENNIQGISPDTQVRVTQLHHSNHVISGRHPFTERQCCSAGFHGELIDIKRVHQASSVRSL